MLDRYLAIDYGTKRIGVALTDPLKITAQPYTTLENNAQLIPELLKIIKEKQVSLIIVGNPLQLNGKPGLATAAVEVFVQKLKASCTIELVLFDERLTTADAEKTMIAHNVRREDRRKQIDQTAAALILKHYMETKGK